MAVRASSAAANGRHAGAVGIASLNGVPLASISGALAEPRSHQRETNGPASAPASLGPRRGRWQRPSSRGCRLVRIGAGHRTVESVHVRLRRRYSAWPALGYESGASPIGTSGTVIDVAPPCRRVDGEIVEVVDGDAGAAMARLIYASNMSLDGCTEDERGAFDWAPPDDDVFVFITGLMRSAGTYLYGRRMYETLAVWETDATLATRSDLTADYASAWQAADKVVYSSTLAAPHTANTRLERHFDVRVVHDLKATAGRDLLVGG